MTLPTVGEERPSPSDQYRVWSVAEANRLAENGHTVTLFVGVPDVLVGSLRFHYRVRSGSFGMADGMYDMIGSAGSGKPVAVRKIW